jgi:VanZ like family.
MSEQKRARLRLFLRLMLIVTLCFIWGNSLLSRDESSLLSQGLTAWLRSIGIPIKDDHFVRKLAHFCEFGLLGCELTLLLWLRRPLHLRELFTSAFLAFLAGAADETIQIFSSRGSQVSDVLLDFCGALTGILFMSLLIRLGERRNRQ